MADIEIVGILFFMLLCLAFPLGLIASIGWILARLLKDLWTGQNGRGRPLEELLLSLGILVAPCLLLLSLEIHGYTRPTGGGWVPVGLILGLCLWGIRKILLLLMGELIVLGARIGRCSWTGEDGWGTSLEKAVFYLAAAGGSVFLFWSLAVTVYAIALDPTPPR